MNYGAKYMNNIINIMGCEIESQKNKSQIKIQYKMIFDMETFLIKCYFYPRFNMFCFDFNINFHDSDWTCKYFSSIDYVIEDNFYKNNNIIKKMMERKKDIYKRSRKKIYLFNMHKCILSKADVIWSMIYKEYIKYCGI